MKRLAEFYLREWKNDHNRKSLLLRGARQVGKTFTVREFGRTFDNTVEVNFESKPNLARIFDHDLNPFRITQDMALACNQPINPGQTLLFLDEIQQAPKALIALRYFTEELPALHVVAAGSLLDFALDEAGIPVGRVSSLWMRPMSFVEFLAAKNKQQAILALADHDFDRPFPEAVHRDLIRDVGEYLAVGGMPEAIREWLADRDLPRCSRVHVRIADAYRQDFAKYSRKHQIKYVELLFEEIPRFLGRRFVFSHLKGAWRRRDLQPALDLLTKSGVAHAICQTAATGIPLGAEQDPERFKTLFLDVGLAEALLGFDGRPWILEPDAAFANAGQLAEAFVGQELLAYGQTDRAASLHYWHREERSSMAEVDYVVAGGNNVIPVEVKSGTTGQMKSLRLFLDVRKEVAPYGVRFSLNNFSRQPDLHSYPLYAVIAFSAAHNPALREAVRLLGTG